MPSNRTASRSSTKFISPMTLSRYGCGKSHMTNKKNPKPNPNVHLTPTLYLISSQIFEVATNTKVKDLIQNIANKLKLSSAHGYSIFVKTQDKVNLTDFELGLLMPLMRSDPRSCLCFRSSVQMMPTTSLIVWDKSLTGPEEPRESRMVGQRPVVWETVGHLIHDLLFNCLWLSVCRWACERILHRVLHEKAVVQCDPRQRLTGGSDFSFPTGGVQYIWVLILHRKPKDTDRWFKIYIFQELPKYLRGYHVSSRDDMINIAALLFRVKVGKDKSQFVMITKMLKELVPSDQLKAISENEWKKVWWWCWWCCQNTNF